MYSSALAKRLQVLAKRLQVLSRNISKQSTITTQGQTMLEEVQRHGVTDNVSLAKIPGSNSSNSRTG